MCIFTQAARVARVRYLRGHRKADAKWLRTITASNRRFSSTRRGNGEENTYTHLPRYREKGWRTFSVRQQIAQTSCASREEKRELSNKSGAWRPHTGICTRMCIRENSVYMEKWIEREGGEDPSLWVYHRYTRFIRVCVCIYV